MNDLIKIETHNGQNVVSSREVATTFNKQHRDVLRSIRELITSVENYTHLFIQSKYMDSYNREQIQYLMTRDGFCLLSMGFNGNEALQWKLKYIEAFNKMEQQLKQQTILTEEDKLILKLFHTNKEVVVESHIKLVELKTEQLQTKVNEQQKFINTFFDKDILLSIDEFCRIVGIGKLNLLKFLRQHQIIMTHIYQYPTWTKPSTGPKHNLPYAHYMKYFELKYDELWEDRKPQVFINKKGQEFIYDLLLCHNELL